MLQKFNQYIKKEKLFTPKQKLLVAVSGGIDSMALCELLQEGKYNFAVAHCNFTLRGAESDGDATFVEGHCLRNKIKYYYNSFDTASIAARQKISTQMAARDLRYTWFAELMKKHKFDVLVTAHHLNDSIETFFINLVRGSGLNGLKGIVPRAEKKVRPLLFATREEIEKYVRSRGILFREDSSNIEDKYLRNRLRHQIVPEFKMLNPSFEETMANELEILQQANEILQDEIEKKKKSLASDSKGIRKIDIEKLKKTSAPKLFLYELLREFGFNSTQAGNMYDALDGLTGKLFSSDTHQLVKDRKHLLVKKKTEEEVEEFKIFKKDEQLKKPMKIKIGYEKIKEGENVRIPPIKNIAFLDAERLEFPLKLIRWQQGDRFRPLGMFEFKKLSDFFVAEKMSLFEKENQWVLWSGKDIAWVVGRRIDDRFKITRHTRKVCILELGDPSTSSG